MKINIIGIIIDHVKTLHDYNHREQKDGVKTEKIARDDFLTFFLLPFFAAVLLATLGPSLNKDTYTVSVSIFAIFSALLLNVQIALFSIYHRSWSQLEDNNLQSMKNDRIDTRGFLIRQLNTNISYSIVVSCSAVMVFFFLYVFNFSSIISTCICYFLFIHFFLTLLMIIKRAHALFDTEYTEKNT